MKTKLRLSPQEIWQKITAETTAAAATEPNLANYFANTILNHKDLGAALSSYLAKKLASAAATAPMLQDIMQEIFAKEPIITMVARDIQATVDRDSACNLYSSPFLYFKGFLSLQAYRAAHELWLQGRTSLALLLQHRISITFAVDIHPAAIIGSGVMIDHATALVIGETAVIEDSVSIMQSVTLGGTGKDSGDRHPKIRKGVLIGPGATILGNIDIGEGAMVAAASVVLKNVAAHKVVAGVPAVEVGDLKDDNPAKAMNHYFSAK
ncbi:serine O-acetyltransferase [Gammaproteobacteria bacterium]|nr:serine O-acetyltransferase [Gammaproteobacteria bacterium]